MCYVFDDADFSRGKLWGIQCLVVSNIADSDGSFVISTDRRRLQIRFHQFARLENARLGHWGLHARCDYAPDAFCSRYVPWRLQS
ncbi:hypothetical protein Thivi_3712 [Thiocystis violascens DSM 198]|uniref:Uncharacterized protein n=1 Tax=Thiocystis violascens (strain ATCC 17096 / DSM 198 / 6111) TaxID=765911 RepID=I3YEZ2_THIV6|nr:hypothetical protein Thivi_3712 [Thiocystis violascens DSM 198]